MVLALSCWAPTHRRCTGSRCSWGFVNTRGAWSSKLMQTCIPYVSPLLMCLLHCPIGHHLQNKFKDEVTTNVKQANSKAVNKLRVHLSLESRGNAQVTCPWSQSRFLFSMGRVQTTSNKIPDPLWFISFLSPVTFPLSLLHWFFFSPVRMSFL